MYTITKVKQAIQDLLAPHFGEMDIKIDVPPAPFVGDFAVPVFALAKTQKMAPPAIAKILSESLDLSGTFFQRVEPQGGFLNFILDPVLTLQSIEADFKRLGMHYGRPEGLSSEVVVVDYSSPNVAKEMHVGHLRSTVIGDSLRRLNDFLGHTVIAQNHLGDWGTQFGMLIEYLVDDQIDLSQPQAIGDLNELYQKAKQRDDSDKDFSERARKRVVLLQGGDENTLKIWHSLIDVSMVHFNEAYRRLGVLLQNTDVRAESSYNADLKPTVEQLKQMGLTTVSEGAVCIFLEGFEREGKPTPMIIQKSDGGYLYHTTDLATLKHRLFTLHATRILYVVDVRQADHFKMLFAAGKKAGWLDAGQTLNHVSFGTILGKDNKPFKTREGGTVKLSDLLSEAVRRAEALITLKNSNLSPDEIDRLAVQVGIGALKYADLSGDRKNDYVFDWDRMLSFEGNTAPYLQYAAVRIHSLLEKAGAQDFNNLDVSLLVDEKEIALSKKLAEFSEVIFKATDRCEPHIIATYLYSLAQSFTGFYDAVPILKTEELTIKITRLWLCARVLQVLKQGLYFLGIECPERM